MKSPALSTVAAWLLLHAGGVSAHHSFVTHYDYDTEITVTGVVTEIRLASPHSFFFGQRNVGGRPHRDVGN